MNQRSRLSHTNITCSGNNCLHFGSDRQLLVENEIIVNKKLGSWWEIKCEWIPVPTQIGNGQNKSGWVRWVVGGGLYRNMVLVQRKTCCAERERESASVATFVFAFIFQRFRNR